MGKKIILPIVSSHTMIRKLIQNYPSVLGVSDGPVDGQESKEMAVAVMGKLYKAYVYFWSSFDVELLKRESETLNVRKRNAYFGERDKWK